MQHESIESPASLPSGSSEVVNPQEERAAGQDGTVAHERAALDGKISVEEFTVDSHKSSSVPISSSLTSSASSIDTVKTITSTSDSSASTPPKAAEPLEASTTASALSRSKASPLPQTPALYNESEEAVRVRKPHRRRNLKDAKPKGILKPPPPPVAKFSFRRDVLGYVVGEAGFTSTYAAGGPAVGGRENTDTKANTTSLQLATDGVSASSSGLQSSSQATSPTSPSAHVTSPSIAGQSVAKSSGGLWRRLGGAVTAVAGNVPVPQSALRTLNNISATVRSPLPLEHVRPASPQRPEGNDLTHTSSTAAANDEISNNSQPKYVKSVRFTMSSLAVVYPINGPAPPGVEADTRKRINKEHAAKQASRKDPAGWTTLDLLELYEDCCRTREEPGIAPLRTLLMSTSSLPKVIDLSNIRLTYGAASVLSDILSINFGLKKLVLDNCGLDDESIKPIIHALLVSGNLPSLSLSNNRKIRSQGWRLIAYYVRRSPYLKYLDASDNIIDKKIADLIGQAIARNHASSEKKFSQQALSTSPSTGTEGKASKEPSAAEEVAHSSEGSEEDEPDPFEYRRATLLQYDGSSTSGLSSLRLENCSLRNPVLDSLSNSIRQSRIKHVSLRRNHINQLGAVALAVLIRDYELSPSPFASTTTTLSQHLSISDTTSDQQSMRHMDAPKSDSGTLRPQSASTGNSVTASLHHLVSSEGTTSLQSFRPSAPDRNDALSPSSSSSHSVSDVDDHENSFGPERNRGRVSVPQREAVRYAEMRQRLQKQIEVLPRVGNLLTLDIRSNDIRGGVTYLAQVLKRNRTLRVLNLSDNKIDPSGLAALSEALKYNSTLETLDLSNNPCCGSSTEGLRSLRTALVLNNSLMRVFLNNTGFDSAGAIALAEYLPDFQSVIHLDVTENAELSIAGVMALAAAIKLNPILRCLDLSIPPNDSEFARLSQDILQACVRNTELAQTRSNMRGAKEVATPIYKSELAREIKELEVSSSRALHAAFPSELQALVDIAGHCINTLTTALPRDEALVKEGQLPIGRYAVHAERMQAQNVQMQLSEAVVTMQGSSDRGAKDALGSLCAHLAILSQRATNLYGFEDEAGNDLRLLTSAGGSLLSPHSPIRSPASPSHQISSPSFSITDSDSSDCDSSEEEVQEQSHSPSDPTDSSIFGEIAKVSGLQAISRQEPPPSLNLPSPTFTEASPSKPSPRSPVENHSRTLTLEEGEVFRRGISKIGEDDDRTLLDVLDGQSGIDGEELKQEILETEVERPRRSSPCVADHEQNGSHDA